CQVGTDPQVGNSYSRADLRDAQGTDGVLTSHNLDEQVVEKFGDQWSRFDQRSISESELQTIFERYFSIFPWQKLTAQSVGFDMGCGSGRWARFVAPRVGKLYCFDASDSAVNVARAALASESNVVVEQCSVDAIPVPDSFFDFGYSLGVLHHVPDTSA